MRGLKRIELQDCAACVIVFVLLAGVGCTAPDSASNEVIEPAMIAVVSERGDEASQEIPWTASSTLDSANTGFEALSFEIPHGWEVEHVPSLPALNLFDASATGSIRERSQVFIRFFDASAFLTLGTVTVHAVEETSVGPYEARRYNISKKPGVPNFPGQPTWRNERHEVTDFRAEDGFTRYYVLARRPGLDEATFQRFLDSVEVAPR